MPAQGIHLRLQNGQRYLKRTENLVRVFPVLPNLQHIAEKRQELRYLC